MKLALRTIAKTLSALSGSLDELRYESDGRYKDRLSSVNKLILQARNIVQDIIEEL
jgi:flagellar hook-associated protein FlgK